MILFRIALFVCVFSSFAAMPAFACKPGEILKSHGIAIHGEAKYPNGFTHFGWVNPAAPKGGKAVHSSIGTFDNLNAYILKGNSAPGTGWTLSTLMAHSSDEAGAAYGFVAESIEVPCDRSWTTFILRKEAQFHDGSPITADDVVFTFELLKTKGHPFYRQYFKDVLRAEKRGLHEVRFVFGAKDNRELPVIIGELPVFSKAYWTTHDFEKVTLAPPMGSGPYKITVVEPGRSITYERVKKWWGRDLPVNKGRYNFDVIQYRHYRDATVALEAFKAGEYNIRYESSAKSWATGYDSPAFRSGRIKKEEIPNQSPVGMGGFVFNTRRHLFRDRMVRRALSYAFDFEWTNKALMHGAYQRAKSNFDRSELAARGLPGKEDFSILNAYRGRVPEEVFTHAFEPPLTDGSGNNRENLRTAMRILKEAGWSVDSKSRRLTHRDEKGNAVPMEFEILLMSPQFERLALPFVANLEKLGIVAHVRTVDDSQYINRTRTFDFDVIITTLGAPMSPGNEQRSLWGSKEADTEGGYNYSGIKDPVVDELVELVVTAPDRATLVARVRALDRVLLWGHYVIPGWYAPSTRIATWDKFRRTSVAPKYWIDTSSWWIDIHAEKRLGH